jgi:hypothetical protein
MIIKFNQKENLTFFDLIIMKKTFIFFVQQIKSKLSHMVVLAL